MKNSMTITNNVVQQVTCADDGTNRLFINDTEIPSIDWVGSGSYTYGSITIDQIADLSGNIQLSEITATHYALVRTVTGSDISGDVVNTFDTYSTEYPDIEERDTVSTLFGKIKKFLADLKSKVNGKVSKSGDTMTGRLTANGKVSVPTDGGTWISQKDTDKASIKVATKAVTDGSRYDSIIGGQSTDDSTWNIGIIDNKIYIGRFASDQTNNSFTASIYIDLINGYVSKANSANDASKLNGHASDIAPSKNTIVMRDGDGYIKAVYYNQSSGAENIASFTSPLIAFFSTDGWLRKTSIDNAGVALRKSVLTWTYLMDKNANGIYTVSSMANFEDICICFGYVNQTQETINIPRARFATGAGIVIKDSVNSQHCEVYYVSATQIKLSNLSNSNWHVVVYGR